MSVVVISECRLGLGWVKEFANTFDTRKEALAWMRKQVVEWLDAFHHTPTACGERFKSDTWAVYRKEQLYYRYVLKAKLTKDEKDLQECK